MNHKRRFIEAASMAILFAELTRTGAPQPARNIVNKASELWDEIEYQCPEEEKPYERTQP